MPETPQQYTQRMLNHSQGKDPLRLQQAAPRKFAALTKGLSKKQLARRPGTGKWSIGEILAHLADVELVIGYRMRLILAANGTAFKPSIRMPGLTPLTTAAATPRFRWKRFALSAKTICGS
jgi:uncharacterized damage-inducible protein DinB